ncbi:MAG: ferredoxin--NADP(+) reductase, partial [Planctomycetes bacterium]|nr:ferredoxin--NADP(+) reductase [Planctomycetota bacterium]
GKAHSPRLYSIASCRLGDDLDSTTVSLCVKRVVFTDEETQEEVRGVASNYLCDLNEGDKINIIGPIGRTFLLPEDPAADIIMVSVGTGIAPFRAFIHHMYKQDIKWKGQVRLFFGAKTSLDKLYMNNQNEDISQYYSIDTFKAFEAISREAKNPDRRYVQHTFEDNLNDIWSIIEKGDFSLYICGMKGMEKGINEVLQAKAASVGLDWDEMRDAFKKTGRWNVEVY